ncbi:amino acid ABC transporter ATP-binding protein [bacterium]|nr:MAG: amino acid ABC transporter ATP-binding protein [bacterium]
MIEESMAMIDSNAQQQAAAVPLLSIAGLRKSYGAVEVLRDVSFDLCKGKTVVVIGPSGSGKSTLLRCINLLEPIDEGTIVFDRQKISGTDAHGHHVRIDIGMVFQNFELFPHLTAIENIMLAPVEVRKVPKAQARDTALALLEKVHIPDKADAFPDELSGGQQQRVAIARALAMNPKLMLYDEPTSALDPEMIKEVLDVILELSNEGMTSVVVTHEMSFARRAADEIVFMDGGRVIERASSERFFGGEVHPRAQKFIQTILH